ncbi:MAG: tetratricopeptide repeat protein [Bryobacteraceae bacterium]
MRNEPNLETPKPGYETKWIARGSSLWKYDPGSLRLIPGNGFAGGYSVAHTWLGTLAYFHEWEWARAEREYKQAIQRDPNDAIAHLSYAVFWCPGTPDRAVSASERGLLLVARKLRGQRIVLSGDHGVRQLKRARGRAASSIGGAAKASEYLGRAAREHCGYLRTFKVDQAFDKLRQDPRFQELVVRLQLQPATINIGVEQFVRIFVRIGCGWPRSENESRCLIARNDGVDWRTLRGAQTFETELVFVIGKSGGTSVVKN